MADEPSILAYVVFVPLFTVGVLLWLFLCVLGLIVVFFMTVPVVTSALRLLGHLIYSITALFCGIEHPLCGLILSWEREEIEMRWAQRQKALDRRNTPAPLDTVVTIKAE